MFHLPLYKVFFIKFIQENGLFLHKKIVPSPKDSLMFEFDSKHKRTYKKYSLKGQTKRFSIFRDLMLQTIILCLV